MKKILFCSLAFVLAISLLLSGCFIQTGGDGKTAIQIKNAGDVDSIPDTLNVTKGSTFGFTLEANPTTGFTWQVYIDDEEIVKLTGEEYVCDDPEADGSGGVTTLTFEALKIGETIVTLEYARDWEGGEVDKTKEIMVIVE